MWPRPGPAAWTEDPGDKTRLLGDAEVQREVGKMEDVEEQS